MVVLPSQKRMLQTWLEEVVKLYLFISRVFHGFWISFCFSVSAVALKKNSEKQLEVRKAAKLHVDLEDKTGGSEKQRYRIIIRSPSLGGSFLKCLTFGE